SIASAAENMLRMVHNMLDVSRAEDATLQLRPESIDIRALVQETCSLMTRRAEEKRVTLVGEAQGPNLILRADRDLMRRTLENLIDNAVRYTPNGSRVTMSAIIQDSEIAITVADEGPGVPADQRERIFEKYAQLERSVDHAQKRFGRGIGLAFVKLAVV